MTEALFGLLLLAVCDVESGGNLTAINRNDRGSPSYGHCQVKLKTARWLGYRGTSRDLWLKLHVNQRWAGQYLRYLLQRYDGDVRLAVSAYNCGHACRNFMYQRRVLQRFNELQQHTLVLNHSTLRLQRMKGVKYAVHPTRGSLPLSQVLAERAEDSD